MPVGSSVLYDGVGCQAKLTKMDTAQLILQGPEQRTAIQCGAQTGAIPCTVGPRAVHRGPGAHRFLLKGMMSEMCRANPSSNSRMEAQVQALSRAR